MNNSYEDGSSEEKIRPFFNVLIYRAADKDSNMLERFIGCKSVRLKGFSSPYGDGTEADYWSFLFFALLEQSQSHFI